MPRGGIRENTGPKTTKPTAEAGVKRVTERGLEELDALFDSMLEAAKGVMFVVSPSVQEKDRPRNAEFIGTAEEVGKPCKACQKTGRTWLVYRTLPDLPMQKYLFDHLAGKAAQKAAERVDPVINVFFGDIDCLAGDEMPRAKPVQREVDTPRTSDSPQETPRTTPPEIGL